jgi:ribosomal protein L18E
VLGRGELTKKLTVRAHAFSASAKEKIEKAGGTVEIVAAGPAAGMDAKLDEQPAE